MLTNLFYISIVLLITFVVVYYLSGLYFNARRKLRDRKAIRYFEEEVWSLEKKYNNSEYFQSLDHREQEALKDRLQKYRETLNDLKNTPSA